MFFPGGWPGAAPQAMNYPAGAQALQLPQGMGSGQAPPYLGQGQHLTSPGNPQAGMALPPFSNSQAALVQLLQQAAAGQAAGQMSQGQGAFMPPGMQWPAPVGPGFGAGAFMPPGYGTVTPGGAGTPIARTDSLATTVSSMAAQAYQSLTGLATGLPLPPSQSFQALSQQQQVAPSFQQQQQQQQQQQIGGSVREGWAKSRASQGSRGVHAEGSLQQGPADSCELGDEAVSSGSPVLHAAAQSHRGSLAGTEAGANGYGASVQLQAPYPRMSGAGPAGQLGALALPSRAPTPTALGSSSGFPAGAGPGPGAGTGFMSTQGSSQPLPGSISASVPTDAHQQQPQQVVPSKLGAGDFGAVRAIMLKQQTTFVQQVLDLHKLMQMQQMIWYELQCLDPSIGALPPLPPPPPAARASQAGTAAPASLPPGQQQQQQQQQSNQVLQGGQAGAGGMPQAQSPGQRGQLEELGSSRGPGPYGGSVQGDRGVTPDAAAAAHDGYGQHPFHDTDEDGPRGYERDRDVGHYNTDDDDAGRDGGSNQNGVHDAGAAAAPAGVDAAAEASKDAAMPSTSVEGRGQAVLAHLRYLANIPSSLRQALQSVAPPAGAYGGAALPDTAAVVAHLQERVRRAAVSGSVVKPAASKLYTMDDGPYASGAARPAQSAQATVTQRVHKPSKAGAATGAAGADEGMGAAGTGEGDVAGNGTGQSQQQQQQKQQPLAQAKAPQGARSSAFQHVGGSPNRTSLDGRQDIQAAGALPSGTASAGGEGRKSNPGQQAAAPAPAETGSPVAGPANGGSPTAGFATTAAAAGAAATTTTSAAQQAAGTTSAALAAAAAAAASLPASQQVAAPPDTTRSPPAGSLLPLLPSLPPQLTGHPAPHQAAAMLAAAAASTPAVAAAAAAALAAGVPPSLLLQATMGPLGLPPQTMPPVTGGFSLPPFSGGMPLMPPHMQQLQLQPSLQAAAAAAASAAAAAQNGVGPKWAALPGQSPASLEAMLAGLAPPLGSLPGAGAGGGIGGVPGAGLLPVTGGAPAAMPGITAPPMSLPASTAALPMPALVHPALAGMSLPPLFAARKPVPGAAIPPPPLGPQVARPAPQPVDLHSAWFAKHIEGRTIGNANSLPCLTAAVAGSLGAMQPLGAGQVAGAASASPAPAGATGAAGADVQAADKLPAAAAGIPVAAAANAEQGVMGTAQAAADDKQQQPQPASADVEGKASAAETDAPPGADASKHAADNAGTAAAAPASSGAPSADAAAAKPAASASVVRWWQDVNATFGKLGMVDPAVIGSQMPLPNGAAGMGGQVPLSAGAAVLQFHQMSLMPPGPGGMGMGVAQGGIMVPGVGVIGHGPGGLHILTDQELMPAPHGLPRHPFGNEFMAPLKKRYKYGAGGPEASNSNMSGAGSVSASASASARSGQPDDDDVNMAAAAAAAAVNGPYGAMGMGPRGHMQQHQGAPMMVMPSAFRPVVPHKARSKRGSNRLTLNTGGGTQNTGPAHSSGTGANSGSWGSGDSASSLGGGKKRARGANSGGNGQEGQGADQSAARDNKAKGVPGRGGVRLPPHKEMRMSFAGSEAMPRDLVAAAAAAKRAREGGDAAGGDQQQQQQAPHPRVHLRFKPHAGAPSMSLGSFGSDGEPETSAGGWPRVSPSASTPRSSARADTGGGVTGGRPASGGSGGVGAAGGSHGGGHTTARGATAHAVHGTAAHAQAGGRSTGSGGGSHGGGHDHARAGGGSGGGNTAAQMQARKMVTAAVVSGRSGGRSGRSGGSTDGGSHSAGHDSRPTGHAAGAGGVGAAGGDVGTHPPHTLSHLNPQAHPQQQPNGQQQPRNESVHVDGHSNKPPQQRKGPGGSSSGGGAHAITQHHNSVSGGGHGAGSGSGGQGVVNGAYRHGGHGGSQHGQQQLLHRQQQQHVSGSAGSGSLHSAGPGAAGAKSAAPAAAGQLQRNQQQQLQQQQQQHHPLEHEQHEHELEELPHKLPHKAVLIVQHAAEAAKQHQQSQSAAPPAKRPAAPKPQPVVTTTATATAVEGGAGVAGGAGGAEHGEGEGSPEERAANALLSFMP